MIIDIVILYVDNLTTFFNKFIMILHNKKLEKKSNKIY